MKVSATKKTAAKKNVANRDLWEALDREIARHEIDWRWVKGHAGDPLNERVDRLAGQARGESRQQVLAPAGGHHRARAHRHDGVAQPVRAFSRERRHGNGLRVEPAQALDRFGRRGMEDQSV